MCPWARSQIRVSLPAFPTALQVFTTPGSSRRVLTSSTQSVYKGSMRIEHKYNHENTPRAHQVGSYVRKVGEDMGTGIVVAVGDADVMDEKTNKVYHQRVYHVHWLQMNNGKLYSQEIEEDIAASSRSVPQFASVNDAQKWMESQLDTGNWTHSAQDAVDASSDMDVALQKMLEAGLPDQEDE